MKTNDLTLTAAMAALICVAGPLTVAIGPVPLSLASFAVYLAGVILGWKRGSLAVAVYLLIGLAGVPVFSGFSGGVQKLFGVTGGYLVGYVFCALITGLFSGEPRADKPRPAWVMAGGMALGTAVLYAVGTAWFMVQTGNTLSAAMGMCVLPFLVGDALKIVAASAIAVPVRRAIYR
ncbi:MAG: biotin transporter BioY [Clostridia bacterium]|nr:biotin transporter BioY [Clostridia bacterium]